MMEFLVLVACMNGKGCSQTSNAYYKAHPELQEMVRKNEEKIKDYCGPIIVEAAAPVAFVAAGGTGNFKIYKNLSLEVKQFVNPTLVYSVGF